jgi:hypothetical protein
MGKQFSSTSRKHRVKTVSKFTARDKWMLTGITICLLAALGVIRWSTLPRPQVPPFLDRAEAQDTLPATVTPVQFNDPMIKEAYTAAFKIPRIVAQQPCYCGCDRIGHRSLLDCFRSTHATGCGICVKEAILANRMHDAGKTGEEIRTAIISGEWNNVR